MTDVVEASSTEPDVLRSRHGFEIKEHKDISVREHDIVAVHGLVGTSEDTWNAFGSTDECWLPKAYSKSRILLYGYNNSEDNGVCFTHDRIVAESQKLLDSLVQLRDEEPRADQKPLIFVSHDIGGCLVKGALIIAAQNLPRYEHVLLLARVLIFFGYPHRPLGVAQLQEQLFSLVIQGRDTAPKWGLTMHLMTSLAENIIDINSRFCQAKIMLRAQLVNIYSSASEQPFSRSDVSMNIAFETMVETDAPYHTMTHLAQEMIENLGKVQTEDWLELGFDDKAKKAARIMWFEASFMPHAPLFHAEQPLDPTLCSALDSLSTSDADILLHIQCKDDSRRSSAAIRQYLSVQCKKANVISFPFRKHDVRFNNVQSMIYTFICQLAHRRHRSFNERASRALLRMSELPGQRLPQALVAWQSFTNWGRYYEDVYLLENLHECDQSSLQLLSHLAVILADLECLFKIIITTNAGQDDHLAQSFEKLPSVIYRKLQYEFDSPTLEASAAMLKEHLTVGESRWVMESKKPSLREESVRASYDGQEISFIISRWLRYRHLTTTAGFRALDPEENSHWSMFKAILSGVPLDRQSWAKSLLSFLLTSFRPLHLEELIAASYLISGNEWKSARDIVNFFGGIIHVQDNEVHFTHPSLRTWLQSSISDSDPEDSAWWHLPSMKAAHLLVASVCLAHATSSKQIGATTQWPTFQKFPYAIMYWSVHYRAAEGVNQPSLIRLETLIQESFEATDKFGKLIEQYSSLGDYFDSIDPSSYRPLPVAAYLGLRKLVSTFQHRHLEDRFAAATEAVKRGHVEIARQLMMDPIDELHIDNPGLERLMGAAILNGDEQVLEFVASRIDWDTHNLDLDRSWLSQIMVKTCWIGYAPLVRKLLALGVDSRSVLKESTKIKFPALGVAIISNATDVITTLLENAQRTDPPWWIRDSEIIGWIMAWANETNLRLFYARGLDCSTVDIDGWSQPLQVAYYNRFASLDILLTMRPYEEYMVKDSSNMPTLVLAAWNRQPKMIAVLLKHNVDINAHSKYGNALFHAAYSGSLEICKMLLEKGGIDINFAAKGQHTPLLEAINNKGRHRVEIVRLLLEHKAGLEYRDRFGGGRTALSFAIGDPGDDIPEIMQLLIDAGADVNATDSEGWTPLLLALGFERPSSYIEILLRAKADIYALLPSTKHNALFYAGYGLEQTQVLVDNYPAIDYTDKYEADSTPLEAALSHDIPEVIELMVKSSKRGVEPLNLALHNAVVSCSEGVLRVLLEAGADINYKGPRGGSPLMYAVKAGNDAAIQVLLEYRANVNSVDDLGRTCLHWLQSKTSIASIRRIVHAGASLDALDETNKTPLLNAVSSDHTDAIRYLLTKPAARKTINITSSSGSPLEMACRWSSKEVVELLVEAQADINLDSGGMEGLPIIRACLRANRNATSEKESIIRYLIEEREASVVRTQPEKTLFSFPIHYASMTCPAQIVELFIKHGALTQLYEPDGFNRLPIHMACYNSLKVVRMLGFSTQDFIIRDIFGRLPLHYAVLSGQIEVIKHVWKETKAADPGFSIDSPDSDGWTALHWAARSVDVGWHFNTRTPNSKQIIQFLLDEGASIHAVAHVRPYGDWPLVQPGWLASDIASYHEATDLVSWLEGEETRRDQILRPADKRHRKIGEKKPELFCDACWLAVYGIHLYCETCHFNLCFKCSGWNSSLPSHNNTHLVTWKGTENDLEEKELSNNVLNQDGAEEHEDASTNTNLPRETASGEEPHVVRDGDQENPEGRKTEEHLDDDDEENMDQLVILEDSDVETDASS